MISLEHLLFEFIFPYNILINCLWMLPIWGLCFRSMFPRGRKAVLSLSTSIHGSSSQKHPLLFLLVHSFFIAFPAALPNSYRKASFKSDLFWEISLDCSSPSSPAFLWTPPGPDSILTASAAWLCHLWVKSNKDKTKSETKLTVCLFITIQQGNPSVSLSWARFQGR